MILSSHPVRLRVTGQVEILGASLSITVTVYVQELDGIPVPAAVTVRVTVVIPRLKSTPANVEEWVPVVAPLNTYVFIAAGQFISNSVPEAV